VRRIVDSNLVKLLVNWFVEAVRDNKLAFIKSSLEVRVRPPFPVRTDLVHLSVLMPLRRM